MNEYCGGREAKNIRDAGKKVKNYTMIHYSFSRAIASPFSTYFFNSGPIILSANHNCTACHRIYISFGGISQNVLDGRMIITAQLQTVFHILRPENRCFLHLLPHPNARPDIRAGAFSARIVQPDVKRFPFFNKFL